MGLDAAELVMAFEEEFGVSIPDAAAARMSTPGDVIEFVAALVRNKTREEIAEAVRRVTLEQLGDVDYGEDKLFVQDLGMS